MLCIKEKREIKLYNRGIVSPTRRLETEFSRLSIDSPRKFETPGREARVDPEDINVLKVLIESKTEC